jgi:hypothetical protein
MSVSFAGVTSFLEPLTLSDRTIPLSFVSADVDAPLRIDSTVNEFLWSGACFLSYALVLTAKPPAEDTRLIVFFRIGCEPPDSSDPPPFDPSFDPLLLLP